MDATTEAESFWEKLYAERPAGQSRVNPVLAEVAGALRPGKALDLGCGAGGDTLWLAGKGWRVTAVDISATAVERVRARAGELGLARLVTAERHDLSRTFPAVRFDLVSAQYFHTPFAFPRAEVLRTAARALRPGGRLLVVDHGSAAPWSWNQDPDAHFPAPAEIAAELDLDPGRWVVRRADRPERVATGPNGETATVVDHVLVIQRKARTADTGPPGTGADEKATLLGFLDYLRGSIAGKVDGVGEPEVRTAGVPSGTSLLGLLKHLTHVERYHLLGEPVADWPGTFRPSAEDTVDSVLAGYRETLVRANRVVGARTDLTAPIRDRGPSLRWVLVHLIEETGRHAGHADILRELIDGSTGR